MTSPAAGGGGSRSSQEGRETLGRIPPTRGGAGGSAPRSCLHERASLHIPACHSRCPPTHLTFCRCSLCTCPDSSDSFCKKMGERREEEVMRGVPPVTVTADRK
ncbi:hypothetical protein AAFF_G00049480 [Aldrovandia affinis]|uniref:Uncharacterized protein n=1 Tax=Aldrovandia affinis TaxID=143900 RepID=A0AAD7S1E6_9TELE|nr:hypothetical protein AAFF_G00049480 [Aldrovandia affinis]